MDNLSASFIHSVARRLERDRYNGSLMASCDIGYETANTNWRDTRNVPAMPWLRRNGNISLVLVILVATL